MPIRRLPPLLVNQIAAGEVIERPASVVKELIENAIDAGATRISVEIEDGGRELIRVADDGCGIPEAELDLALAPHATSKIVRAEDLEAISTMGFRGEALASIASVARVSLLSRPASQAAAAAIDAEGGALRPVKPASGPCGTTVIVRNLFFNTPARRKFLRTAQTEASRVAESVESMALAHPAIAFLLKSEGRVSVDLAPVPSPRIRVLDVLGRDLDPHLLEVDVDRGGDDAVVLWGLIGTPEIARGNANHQRLYLNGRPIRDRSLQHALKEAYRGLIEPGRSPTLVIFLEMNPRQVDVNVHPTKAEVRFRNQGLVHGVVFQAVRDRLREADLTPRFELERTSGAPPLLPNGPPPAFGPSWTAPAASASMSPLAAEPKSTPSAREFVEYFRRLDPVQKGLVYSEVKQAAGAESDVEGVARSESSNPAFAPAASVFPSPVAAASILHVHSSYLVTQDERGLVIIDQHALHERVMFEELVQRVSKGPLESQRLLIPEIVEADRAMVERLADLAPLLAAIGVEAEPIGPASIAVHAFPSFLIERGVEVVPFMRQLLERAIGGGLDASSVEGALHETLDMMACRAAVKAGDRLSPQELKDLLASRERIERSSNCPHGRPTSLRLTIADLDRQFGRS